MRFSRASLFSGLMAGLLTLGAQAQEAPAESPEASHKEVASCDICLPSAVPRGPIQVFFEPGWQVGVDHQYTPLKDMHFDSDSIANPAGERILSNTTHFNFTYNVTEKAGFIITIPFHNKDYRRLTAGGVEQGTVSGIGDMVVRARFSPVAQFSPERALVWTVEAGLKLPTGDSSMLREQHSHAAADAPHDDSGDDHDHDDGHHDDDDHDDDHDHDEGEEHHDRGWLGHGGVDHGGGEEEEEHHETPLAAAPVEHIHSAVEGHDLALGSGSVDGVLGTGVVFRQGRFYAAGGGQYLLRSQGTAGYRYGDMLTWRVAPGYLFVNEENQVIGLQLNVAGEHHDPNRIYNVKDHGYVDIIYAGPELLAQGESLSLGVGLDLPVKYHAEGVTLAPDYRARFHFNWRF